MAGVSARGPERRRFIEVPAAPMLRDVLQEYGVPPRDPCECGARAGGWHTPDCHYSGYPSNIVDPVYRPSLAAELRLRVDVCGVCRVTDGAAHLYWCTWWNAHPEAPAPW